MSDREASMLQLRAGATVASLLEFIDLFRIVEVRDRLYPAFSASASKVPAQQGYREYLRFLTIKILSAGTPALDYSPSVYIDQLWHAHILDTKAWLDLTDRYPRDKLVHDPCPPEGLHASRLKNTIARYIELFAESPLRDAAYGIWNEPDLPPTAHETVPTSMLIPTPPRSASPASSTSTSSIPSSVGPSLLSASHARILLYHNYNWDEEPQATLESHTNDTIASIIRKYQVKRNLTSNDVSRYHFFLFTPGFSHTLSLSDKEKTLGMYLASRPSAIKQLAKSIEVRIQALTVLQIRAC